LTHPPLTDRCRIRGCDQPATVHVGFDEWSGVGASLCGRHKPTVEQALRRGIVAKHWTIDGYYPREIAMCLSNLTGHTIRESTVLADLKWLGLTEAHRAAGARLNLAVALGEAGPNVVPLRRA
jgi:hypothetical protein